MINQLDATANLPIDFEPGMKPQTHYAKKAWQTIKVAAPFVSIALAVI